MAGLPRPGSLPAFPWSLVKAPLPTAQKDRIYYGKQAQFNAYKQSLRAQQGEQQMAGSPTFTEEGAGPYNIQVQQFDGFGPMYDDSWDQ
jgi:hypothetical protein